MTELKFNIVNALHERIQSLTLKLGILEWMEQNRNDGLYLIVKDEHVKFTGFDSLDLIKFAIKMIEKELIKTKKKFEEEW